MDITCKICNQELTLRSFAMHLRWSHNNMKNEDYIKQFGEFRPKFLVKENIKQESTTKCEICNEKMMHNQQLMYHITKKHPEISKQDYIIRYVYKGVAPLCKCGCGNPVKIIPHGKENKFHVDYIKGHWDWVKPGYFTHSNLTKDLMSIKAKERFEKQINEQGYPNIHLPEVLAKRRESRKLDSLRSIEEKYNILVKNKDEIITVSSCNKFVYKCIKCSYTWEQSYLIPRCIKCNPHQYNNVSKEEQEISELISQNYKGLIKLNSYEVLEQYETDIYLPELNLAIEYNGLYWHSEIYKEEKYHYNKFTKAKDNKVKLIQIFSDEWLNKTEIVKSRLLNLIGKSPNKVYARKCEIREVEVKEKNRFLNNNHIQGEDKSAIKLGLYYNNELVSLMTFGKPRVAIGKKQKINENEWELVRFCNKVNTNVVGGASKLFKHFIKIYKPNHIYSFADNRWSSPLDNLYVKLGFTLTNISTPGYWYTKNFTDRYHRYNFRKQRLKELGFDIENRTEKDIMEELKYYKVWDCGTSRYEISFENHLDS